MSGVIVMRGSDDEAHSRDDGDRQNSLHIACSFGYEEVDTSPHKRAYRTQEKNDGKGCGAGRQFCCLEPGCNRMFSSRFKLMRHKLIHSGERKFKCSVCERRFHRKDHLKNHLKVHNPQKVIHTCELCYKTYSSLLSYKKHLAFHAAEAGDLACKLCGKIFADQGSIMHHLKVHTGSRTLKGPSERKFKCDQCDRSFFTKKDVKRHLVVHTGMRNFSCHQCPQRFGRKDHLVRHVKKSHGNQPLPTNPPNPERVVLPVESQASVNSNRVPVPSISEVSRGGLMTASGLPSVSEVLVKEEPYYLTGSSIPQGAYGNNSILNENGDSLGRLADPSLLPVTQYLPIPHSFSSGITHILPSYPGTVPISNMLPGLSNDSVLPSISGTGLPSFSSSMTGSTSLPHFSQAFH